MPLSISRLRMAGVLLTGPIVQTIFALRMIVLVSPDVGSFNYMGRIPQILLSQSRRRRRKYVPVRRGQGPSTVRFHFLHFPFLSSIDR